MEKKLVITIEREYGSGGRVLGQQLSQLLGIEYYDDDIIKTASETSRIPAPGSRSRRTCSSLRRKLSGRSRTASPVS